MALKNLRTQKNKTNRRKQQSKRGGKRIGKNTKKSLINKRQTRRMRGGGRFKTSAGLAGSRAAKKKTHVKGMGAPGTMVDVNAERRMFLNIEKIRLRNIVKKRISTIFKSGENPSDQTLLGWPYADDNGTRINVDQDDIQFVINQVRNERNPYLKKVNPELGYATGEATGSPPFSFTHLGRFDPENMNYDD